MIRKFKILDKEPIDWYGYLYYNTESKEFTIKLREHIDLSNCPPMFDTFIERGELDIPPEWTIRWIRQRIFPPERHAVGIILRDIGLTEYDEFEILMYTKGVCDMDKCYLEEVTECCD